jgi:hypothetical protein
MERCITHDTTLARTCRTAIDNRKKAFSFRITGIWNLWCVMMMRKASRVHRRYAGVNKILLSASEEAKDIVGICYSG